MVKLDYITRAWADEVYKLFVSRRDMFPHIRFDQIQRRCAGNQCLADFKSGVAITFQQYTRRVRLGDVLVPKGAIMLHQIVSTKQRGAADEAFMRFRELMYEQYGEKEIYLTVRASNLWARAFYERNGMLPIGKIAWKGGELPGVVYVIGARYFFGQP